MKNSYNRGLIIATSGAGVAALILYLVNGGQRFVDGLALGIFLVLLGNLLVVLLINNQSNDIRTQMIIHFIRSAIRVTVLASVFCVGVFILKVDSLGLICGIASAACLSGIFTFIYLRPALVQKGNG